MNETKLVLSGVGAIATSVFGVYAFPLFLLFIVIICDYVTGMYKAYKCGTLCRKIGFDGIIKKIFYFVLIVVAGVLDWVLLFGLSEVGVHVTIEYCLAMLVIIFLIINECISIMGNLGQCDLPIPPFLIKVLAKIKSDIDDKTL